MKLSDIGLVLIKNRRICSSVSRDDLGSVGKDVRAFAEILCKYDQEVGNLPPDATVGDVVLLVVSTLHKRYFLSEGDARDIQGQLASLRSIAEEPIVGSK